MKKISNTDEYAWPQFVISDDWEIVNSSSFKPGVWCIGIGKQPLWICSPLHVNAITFDDKNNNFGRLLRFKPTEGAWREWNMPMRLLAGPRSIKKLRATLLNMGVTIAVSARSRRLFTQYLSAQHPEKSCVMGFDNLKGAQP